MRTGRMITRTVGVAGVLALAAVGLGGPAGAGATTPVQAERVAAGGPDFDADGYADLVIGVPGEDIGTVRVVYGTPDGLSADRTLRISPDDKGMVGDGSARDFGRAIAWADFDADGFDDLAIAAPYEAVDDQSQAGSVRVLYGGADGLGIPRNQWWTLADEGLVGDPQDYQYFGWDIAAGDFDGDGHSDLAALIRENFDGISPNIRVLYGAGDGLRSDRSQQLGLTESQTISSVRLAGGDLDGNGMDELVVGQRTAVTASGAWRSTTAPRTAFRRRRREQCRKPPMA